MKQKNLMSDWNWAQRAARRKILGQLHHGWHKDMGTERNTCLFSHRGY